MPPGSERPDTNWSPPMPRPVSRVGGQLADVVGDRVLVVDVERVDLLGLVDEQRRGVGPDLDARGLARQHDRLGDRAVGLRVDAAEHEHRALEQVRALRAVGEGLQVGAVGEAVVDRGHEDLDQLAPVAGVEAQRDRPVRIARGAAGGEE